MYRSLCAPLKLWLAYLLDSGTGTDLLLNPNAPVAARKGMRAVKLLQQNTPVRNYGCRITQVVLCNDCQTFCVYIYYWISAFSAT